METLQVGQAGHGGQREGPAGLGEFLAGVERHVEIWRRARRELDVYLGREFSVFHYIRPDENRLSEIIGDLLDPQGRHGQGSRFLSSFLNMLRKSKARVPDLSAERLAAAQVVCEASTGYLENQRRRLDIRVTFPGEFALGIENKPWAGWQPKQLTDYAEELERRYHGRFVLCSLGSKDISSKVLGSEERLESEGRFRVLHYAGELVCWLRTCTQVAEAEKIRWFLRDFIAYVESELAETSDEEVVP